MAEICREVQFGITETIFGYNSLILYQQTRFPGVNIKIGDSQDIIIIVTYL